MSDLDDARPDYRYADIRIYGSVNKAFLLERGWTRTAIKRNARRTSGKPPKGLKRRTCVSKGQR